MTGGALKKVVEEIDPSEAESAAHGGARASATIAQGKNTASGRAGGSAGKRPDPNTRFDAIIDAAEAVFASSGFNGASIREIAGKAGVAQALVHYHFETKEKLFEATTSRRSIQINSARGRMLDDILADDETVTLERLVEALFRPTIETGHKLAHGGNNFSRILVSIANSHEERDQKLAEHYYDPIARRFIQAFSDCLPGMARKRSVWAYMFSIGVGMTMMAQTGRSNRLSNGECDDRDVEAMLEEIVTYVCGGIRAMATKK